MTIYCVYVTLYRGNKLPPFYIGSTSLDRISKGYRGSVSSREYRDIWKQEIKENPHLFQTKIICKFNNRFDARSREDSLQRKLLVIQNSLYTNKAYASGCFGGSFGRKHSEETKRKIGEKSKLPKTKRKSEEAKRAQSEAMKAKHQKCKETGERYHSIFGEKNGMYGKTPKNATPCTYAGIEFPSKAAASRYKQSVEIKVERTYSYDGQIFDSKEKILEYKANRIDKRLHPIVINGIVYASRKDAMHKLNLKYNEFYKKISNGDLKIE